MEIIILKGRRQLPMKFQYVVPPATFSKMYHLKKLKETTQVLQDKINNIYSE